MQKGLSLFNKLSLVLVYLFLYLPILILIVFSFNSLKSVTVWGGFSTQWYTELFNNQGMIDAAWVTLRVAVASSTVATVLGVLAGLTLARYGRFRGRTLFSGMIYAPLVLPDVIIGFSLLMTFVTLSIDRGIITIIFAHISFSMCYVAVVIQSKFRSFDDSVEEAALDLGCTPFRTFFAVILPMILPAVISGWLLSFTLSLDDLVIANFVAGPGSSTLPIKIYSQVRLGVTPEINALSTILIGLVATGVLVAAWVSRFQESKRKHDQLLAKEE